MWFGRLIRWQQVEAAKSREKRAVQVGSNKQGRHSSTAAGVLANHTHENNAHAPWQGKLGYLREAKFSIRVAKRE